MTVTVVRVDPTVPTSQARAQNFDPDNKPFRDARTGPGGRPGEKTGRHGHLPAAARKRRRDPTGGTPTSPLYDRDIGRPAA